MHESMPNKLNLKAQFFIKFWRFPAHGVDGGKRATLFFAGFVLFVCCLIAYTLLHETSGK